MSSANLEWRVTIGPFRMPHLAVEVNERMRQALLAYLIREVVPLLEGDIARIDGRVTSHYDRPEFSGIPEVRHRYYYELGFSSPAGVEDAWGELDYNPNTATWTPSPIKPSGVRTLTEKRALEEEEQARAEFRRRYAHHGGDECPACHSTKVAALLYGLVLPNEKLWAEIEAGRVRLAGCCVSNESPIWRCLSCGSEWGSVGVGRKSRD